MKQPDLNRRDLLAAIGGLAAASVTPAAAHFAILNTQRQPARMIETIIDIAARSEGLTAAEILGPSRERPFVRARQRAMYLARQATERSLPELGRRFGGRDHTTVLHALRKITVLVEHDDRERRAIEILRTAIERRTGIVIPNRAVLDQPWVVSPYDEFFYPKTRIRVGIGV